MTKEKSPRKEVAKQRRDDFVAKHTPSLIKLVAGIAIVAASYSSIYRLLLDLIKNNPEYFAAGIAALAITALVCVVAHFDTKK